MINLRNAEKLENRIAPDYLMQDYYGDQVTQVWNQFVAPSNTTGFVNQSNNFTEGFTFDSGQYAGYEDSWTISGQYASDIGATLYTQIQNDMAGTGASLLQASNDVMGLQNGMFVNAALYGVDPLRH